MPQPRRARRCGPRCCWPAAVAGPQHDRQRLAVLGGAQHRMEPEPRLEMRRRSGLVLRVHLHQRRVDVQHHRQQTPPCRRGAPTQRRAQPQRQPKSDCTASGPQAPQRAIQRRVRRHLPEQHRLGPQMLVVAARLPAAPRASTTHEPAPRPGHEPAPAHRRAPQQADNASPSPKTVSETPQNEQTPMRRDLIAAPRHPHITSAATVHLGDAPSSGSDTCRDTRIIPHRRGFSADAHPLNAKTCERSGLKHYRAREAYVNLTHRVHIHKQSGVSPCARFFCVRVVRQSIGDALVVVDRHI